MSNNWVQDTRSKWEKQEKNCQLKNTGSHYHALREEETLYLKLAKFLAHRNNRSGMKQEDIADKLGYSRQWLNQSINRYVRRGLLNRVKSPHCLSDTISVPLDSPMGLFLVSEELRKAMNQPRYGIVVFTRLYQAFKARLATPYLTAWSHNINGCYNVMNIRAVTHCTSNPSVVRPTTLGSGEISFTTKEEESSKGADFQSRNIADVYTDDGTLLGVHHGPCGLDQTTMGVSDYHVAPCLSMGVRRNIPRKTTRVLKPTHIATGSKWLDETAMIYNRRLEATAWTGTTQQERDVILGEYIRVKYEKFVAPQKQKPLATHIISHNKHAPPPNIDDRKLKIKELEEKLYERFPHLRPKPDGRQGDSRSSSGTEQIPIRA